MGISVTTMLIGARGSVVVKALCYKPGSRSNEIVEFFNLPNRFGRTSSWGLLSLRKIVFLGSRARPVRSWQPYRHLWADCLNNVASLTSHNPTGLHGLLQEQLYFTKVIKSRHQTRQDIVTTYEKRSLIYMNLTSEG
jgi:hypothetical protein